MINYKYVCLPIFAKFFSFSDFNRPKCEVKSRMAKAIVEEFPSLKDDEGLGFVSTLQLSNSRFLYICYIKIQIQPGGRRYIPQSLKLAVAPCINYSLIYVRHQSALKLRKIFYFA